MFLRNQVLVYSVLQMLYGLTFWIWALYNVLNVKNAAPSVFHHGVDYGMFTFPILFFAGLNGLTSIRNPHVSIASRHAKAHVLLVGISHSLVSLNYIIGGIIADKHEAAFKLYCYGCAVLFAVTGLCFTYLSIHWRMSFDKMQGALSLNMY